MTLEVMTYVTYFNFRVLATQCWTLGLEKPEKERKRDHSPVDRLVTPLPSFKASISFVSLTSELGRDLSRSLILGLELKD